MKRKIKFSIFKGQILLMSVLLMSVVSFLALSLANIYLRELRLAGQTTDSVKALYAADAAIECGLFKIFIGLAQTCQQLVKMSNDTSFEEPREEILAPGAYKIIKSDGISRGVRRSMEVTLTY